ncbi:MAG: TonB-dependent receptor plug domain-containing protein, partial [Sphingomonadaceae bacterium]
MPIYTHALNFIGTRAGYLIGSGALAIMIAQPAAVRAQTEDTPSAAEATPSSGAQLEDIVVTAQRRGQNLQDVPLSVTAFNATTLAQSGVTTVRELNQVDSALNINQSSGVVVPFLRGVGNPSGSTIGNEASVPIYIDEVYYSRLAPIDLELANIERVEVLKGPQGTLFGRNASGGAIQVFTRDPGDELELSGKLGYANYQTYSGQLYVAAPITDTVGASISFSGSDQRDGWGKNLVTGQDTYRNKYINVRGKIVADLTPTTKVHLTGFYNWQRTGQGITNGLYEGRLNTDPQTGATIAPPGIYDAITTENNFIRHKGHGVS